MSHPKLTCQKLMVEGDGLWIAGGSRMCILVKYREEEKGLQRRGVSTHLLTNHLVFSVHIFNTDSKSFSSVTSIT